MKNLENNPKKIPNHLENSGNLKTTLIAGLATISSMAGFSQTNQAPKNTLELTTITTTSSINPKQEIVFDSITALEDPIKVYAQNKETYDQGFEIMFSLEDISPTEKVSFRSHGKESFVIKVKHINQDHLPNSEESFTNLQELNTKYPDYASKVSSRLDHEYHDYVLETAYEKMIANLNLPLEVHDYTPSREEVDILKHAAEIKNNGGVTDGYDEIYHYYQEQAVTPKDRYLFCLKHHNLPSSIANYMVKKYYKPLVKKEFGGEQ